MVWFGSVWCGLAGLVWFGLDLFGILCSRLGAVLFFFPFLYI